MSHSGSDRTVQRVLAASTHFEVLGLPNAPITPRDAGAAFRKLSLTVHPDHCSHPQAAEAMRRVAEAHRVVGRPHRQGAHLSHLRRRADVAAVPEFLRRFRVTAGVALAVLSAAALYGWSLRASRARDRPAKRSPQPQA